MCRRAGPAATPNCAVNFIVSQWDKFRAAKQESARRAVLNLHRRANFELVSRRSLVCRDLARKARFAKPRAARALSSLLCKISRSQ